MQQKYLLQQLIKRDFKRKYKGTVLGVLWPLVVPLLMLVVYTFVFSVIFKARWDASIDNSYEYALMIFCGLSSFNMVSEVMVRACTIISGNVNYVKKVIFPLEMFPITITITAMINCLISYGMLLIVNVLFTKRFYVTSIELVLQFIPLVVLCLGIAFLLSALSVYYKDIENAIGILSTMLLYVSPVFYSLEAVPGALRNVAGINPLSYIIENARRVCLNGRHMDYKQYLCSVIISFIIFLIGYFVFKRAKDGFADVL